MLFHAGTANSDVFGSYFSLYKGNRYQCCDDGYSTDKWYTGDYSLSGDTIVLNDLKKHHGIPSNRFLIRRYQTLDSNYWQWKYPNYKGNWQVLKHGDSLSGSTGDVLMLDEQGKIVFHKNNYFLIRMDKLNTTPK